MQFGLVFFVDGFILPNEFSLKTLKGRYYAVSHHNAVCLPKNFLENLIAMVA